MKTLLISLFPLLGLVVGYLLRKIASEELQQGKPYFLLLRRVLLFLLTVTLLLAIPLSLPTGIAFIIGIIIAKVLRVRYLYLGCAAVASLSLAPETMLFVIAVLFLYGFPFGTQMITKNPVTSIIKHAIPYLIPFLLLLTLFASHTLLPAFVAGTLFLRE